MLFAEIFVLRTEASGHSQAYKKKLYSKCMISVDKYLSIRNSKKSDGSISIMMRDVDFHTESNVQ